MFRHRSPKKIQGLSLIELMVAVTLSVLVVFLVSRIYLYADKNFQTQLDWSRLEENAMLATELLTQELKKAGYIGCAKLTADFPIYNSTSRNPHPQPFSPRKKRSGRREYSYELTFQNKVTVGAHQVTVRYAQMESANIINASETHLVLTRNPVFAANDILMISDCKKAEIFKVKKIYHSQDKQIIIPESTFHFSFGNDAEVSRLEINTFYVAKDVDHASALFKQDIKGARVALVGDVIDMHFEQEKKGISFSLVFSQSLKKLGYGYVAFER